MKLDSKYFDSIRVKPHEDRLLREKVPVCEWPDCSDPGTHPAPKGRDNEKDYYYFCLNHVRDYNKGYNYFNGMGETDVASYLASAQTGHRPTWKLGDNSWAAVNGGKFRKGAKSASVNDPFGLFKDAGTGEMPGRPRRSIRNAELKALHELGLDETATPDAVQQQYKTLLKRLHPDANNGSRANEEKLNRVIRAHDYLKGSGFLRKAR